MEIATIAVLFMIVIRISTLSGEQVAIHGLSQGRTSSFPTMGVAFWGATVVLWMIALAHGQVVWIGSTIWTGAVYAIAFALYTASLAIGPVGKVSSWTNATIIMLWLIQPTGAWMSLFGITIFAIGAWQLISRQLTGAVVMMIVSDVFLVIARLLDVSHTNCPVYAYAACMFTSISLWMSIPIISSGQVGAVFRLLKAQPGWSAVASTTNGLSYLALFILLHWLPPALVEAISAIAGFTATVAGIVIFREPQGKRKIWASGLMTLGVAMLLLDHFQWLIFDV